VLKLRHIRALINWAARLLHVTLPDIYNKEFDQWNFGLSPHTVITSQSKNFDISCGAEMRLLVGVNKK
jgi:hypothetical protein